MELLGKPIGSTGAAAACRNHEGGKKNFIATMDRVDEEMGREGGPYFLGAEISMVDLVFAPFLERIVASIPYYKVCHLAGFWHHPSSPFCNTCRI